MQISPEVISDATRLMGMVVGGVAAGVGINALENHARSGAPDARSAHSEANFVSNVVLAGTAFGAPFIGLPALYALDEFGAGSGLTGLGAGFAASAALGALFVGVAQRAFFAMEAAPKAPAQMRN